MARLQNEDYLNWLRGSLSLLFVKEGIEAFINRRVADFHERLKEDVSQQPGQLHASLCNTCTHQDIERHNHTWRVRCTSKLCNTWLKQILRYHAHGKNPTIACTNLKSQLWPTEPWEVAKFFLPHGSENITEAKDADVAAILKFMTSCMFMYTFTDRSLVQEVLDVRHRLMHSNNMATSDNELKRDTDNMIKLLNSLVGLTQGETEKVQGTINNICKLRDKTIDVTLNREVVVLTTKMQAVEADLASLEGKCKGYENDLTTLSGDLHSLDKEYRPTNDEIDQLKTAKDNFEEFLQKNDLLVDVSRLSKSLREYGEKLNLQDERIDQQNERLGKQDERLGQQDEKLGRLDERLGQQDEILGQQDERLGRQNERLGQQDEILGRQDERLGRQDERLGQQDEILGRQDERLGRQDERLCQQDEILGRQDEKLGQQDERLGKQDERIGQQDERLGQQAQQMSQQGERLDNQDQRISIFEESMKHKDETAAHKSTCSWEEHCKGVQQNLLDLYNTKCSWENAVTTDQQCILDMYVPPAVKLMREKDEYGGLEEVKMEQSQPSRLNYQQIFYSRSGPCTNLYITGDAGTGKTTFCNQLALTWCMAVKNIQDGTVSAEDLAVLSTFKFLFYINLRDTEKIYHVEDMIKEQLMQYAPRSIDVSTLLRKEKCLIVLDGLDEWSCPDEVKKCPGLNKHIPGRNIINKNCVFLTTTRSWKYDVSDLKTKDVDKHVEFGGIDENSSKELAQRLLDYLDRKSKLQTNIDAFDTEIRRKKLTDLITVPVLLIQLVTLWHYGKDFGNSQLQLYCSMLDLLFERSEKRMSEKQPESTCKTVKTGKTIKKQKILPNCFSTKEYCHSHTGLIMCLAELAYKSLFNKQREDALVFKSTKLDIFGISSSDIKLCLQSGILSQNKDFGNYTGRYKKLSFLHKKMQEFLAALHIVTAQPVKNTLKYLREFCNSIDIMLEMSQVLLFVCGMSPDVARHLLKHFTDVITADTDKQIQKYRQSLRGGGLIRDIQTFVADCLFEGENNGHKYDKIGLEDVYIDRHTFSHVERALLGNIVSGRETIYSRNVSHAERALPGNVTSCIKSMYIDTRDMTVDQSTLITVLLLHSQAVQKLYLNDFIQSCPSITRKTLTPFLHNCRNTLTSIELFSQVTLTESEVTSICHSSSECLMALRLFNVRLTHVDKVKLLNGLSQSHTIRHLYLVLYCTDHGFQCRPRIDMSTMTQLQTLELWCMCVDNLPTVTQCVERVNLLCVTLPMAALCEFARRISQTKRYVDVKLRWVTVREEREDRVDLETFPPWLSRSDSD